MAYFCADVPLRTYSLSVAVAYRWCVCQDWTECQSAVLVIQRKSWSKIVVQYWWVHCRPCHSVGWMCWRRGLHYVCQCPRYHLGYKVTEYYATSCLHSLGWVLVILKVHLLLNMEFLSHMLATTS